MIDLVIVGMGRWGQTLVESVQGKSNDVRFKGVVSRSAQRVGAAADRLGLKLLPDLDAALSDDGVDGIVLATPHSLHAEQIIACAEAGKPVFVEKPFTLTLADAKRAVAAVSATGIVCAAGHNRRFQPSMVALGEAVRTGRLGQVLFAECNYSGNVVQRYTPDAWRVAPGESPGGGLAGAGIHMIDAVVWLLGPITEVTAHSSRLVLEVPMDDTTSAVLVTRSGAVVSLVTLMATVPEFRLKLFGTEACAELRGSETLIVSSLDGGEETTPFDPVDIERAELEAFAGAIAGRVAYPVTLEEVLWGVAAFEGVIRSAAERRWVATLDGC